MLRSAYNGEQTHFVEWEHRLLIQFSGFNIQFYLNLI
jgi:hypothetical protein